jgi:membrane protein required for beta-lactamase induction
MSLIAIIVALVAERLLGHVPGWGTPMLLRSYVAAMRSLLPLRMLWRGALVVPVLLAPPVALSAWLQGAIESPVLNLLFSGLVVFLCLGPRDLADDVKQWLEARAAGDQSTAERLARLLQKGPGRYSDGESPHPRSLLGAMFIQSHERLFGVLIWFFVFGATGAVFYRIVSRLPRLLTEVEENSPAAEASETLHALAAWAPARVTAAIYGLAGSLDDALKEYRVLMEQPTHGWRSHTWAVLAEVASGSIEFETEDGASLEPATLELAAKEVVNLQFRALMILLAFVAVFATGDFLS